MSVNNLDGKLFNELIAGSKNPVVVDFWASWCAPCRMMSPTFHAVAEKYNGKVEFAKVNIDENATIADKYKINSIPNLILFKNGEPVSQSIGLLNEAELIEFIEENIK